jgi:hypothetical protein
MPAFTFEKILPEKLPQVRPGPLPDAEKKPRGVVALVLDRFVAVRLKLTLREDKGGFVRRAQRSRD